MRLPCAAPDLRPLCPHWDTAVFRLPPGPHKVPTFLSCGWAGELPATRAPAPPPRLCPWPQHPQPHPTGLIYRTGGGAAGIRALVFSPGLKIASVTMLKPQFLCGYPSGVWLFWHRSCSTA